MSTTSFNSELVAWQTITGIEHLHYSILDIDTTHNIIDVLFKFAAQQSIVLHRHKVLNKTWVLQGEHRIYHPDGSLKEVRALGSYTSSEPSETPHREGGGAEDTIVFFSIRGCDGVLYEILDDHLNCIATLSLEDFQNLYQKQLQ